MEEDGDAGLHPAPPPPACADCAPKITTPSEECVHELARSPLLPNCCCLKRGRSRGPAPFLAAMHLTFLISLGCARVHVYRLAFLVVALYSLAFVSALLISSARALFISEQHLILHRRRRLLQHPCSSRSLRCPCVSSGELASGVISRTHEGRLSFCLSRFTFSLLLFNLLTMAVHAVNR